MNAVIVNKKTGTRMSVVLTQEEAEKRLDSGMFPRCKVELVDEPVHVAQKLDIVAEEIEDKGCAGGGCTL
ncbi:MAG: hypothetical protein ACRC9P_00950 [Bacteroides sp.]